MKKFLLPMVSGILLSLSLLDHLEALVLVALVPLFISWIQPNKKICDHFLSGFIAQLIFFSTTFYWIQAAGRTYFLLNSVGSFLFCVVFVGGLSLQWGLIGALIGYLRKHCSTWTLYLVPTLMLLLDDLVFKFLPFHFGFHWYIGNWPGLSWAQFIGLNGLGIFVLLINAFIAAGLKNIHRKIAIAGLVSVGLFLALAPQSHQKDQKQLTVLGVQGNISNEIKRTDLQVMQNKMIAIDQYYSLTRKALSTNKENVDLIVWPETTLPFVWKESAPQDPLQEDVVAFSKRIENPILSGGYYDDGGIYNSVLQISPAGGLQAHSEKNILFPIGEVIPFNDFAGLTKDMFPEVPRFQANKLPNILQVSGLNTIVPICYESLFLEYFTTFQKPIEMIVSISNDAWFESDLQKKWHAVIALAISVELQVPVIRVTNNGASGFSQASGKYELYKNSVEDTFVMTVAVGKKTEASFIQKNGELVQRIPRMIAYLILIVMIAIIFKRKSN